MPHFHFCRHLLFIITVFIKHSEGGDDITVSPTVSSFPCASLPCFLLDWRFLGEDEVKGKVKQHGAQGNLRHSWRSLDPSAVGLASSWHNNRGGEEELPETDTSRH